MMTELNGQCIVLEYGRWRNARYVVVVPVAVAISAILSALLEWRLALRIALFLTALLIIVMALNFWLESRSPRRFELSSTDMVVRWKKQSRRVALADLRIREHFIQDLLVGNAVRMDAPGVSFLVFRNLPGFEMLQRAVKQARVKPEVCRVSESEHRRPRDQGADSRGEKAR